MTEPDPHQAAVLDALLDMLNQFAYRTVLDGQPAQCTGGLSALEGAFDVLGWDDPHIIEDPVWCDADVMPRCPQQISAGVPTDDGYKHFCSEHYRLWRHA